MPLELNAHFAVFSPGGVLPGNGMAEVAASIASLYEQTCAGELSITPRLRDDVAMPSNAARAHAVDLHHFARKLNGNQEYWGDPRPTGPRIRNISVIYADRYGPHDSALGVMFDRGFTTSDDGSSSRMFTGVPREACAVFLGRLRELRPTDAELMREASFTTAHELGHVFNLTHTFEELTYLSSSRTDSAYAAAEVGFNLEQQRWLQSCNQTPYVWPGGSRFADPGPSGHLSCAETFSNTPFPFGLELKIDMSLREFQRFFPVELDVTLQTANGVERRFFVPDTIDPGYENFRIWIEEPDGSRRRYQSPRRYCPSGARIGVSPGKPFRRDISLFGEAGGYTFRVPGIHHIWCEFDAGRRGTIRSNRVDVNILPSSIAADDPVQTVLSSGWAPQVLYHRIDPARGRSLHKLSQACELLPPNSAARAALHYATGRAWLSELLRESRARDDTLQKAASRALTSAADAAVLGEHRLAKIDALLSLMGRKEVERGQLVWCKDH